MNYKKGKEAIASIRNDFGTVKKVNKLGLIEQKTGEFFAFFDKKNKWEYDEKEGDIFLNEKEFFNDNYYFGFWLKGGVTYLISYWSK